MVCGHDPASSGTAIWSASGLIFAEFERAMISERVKSGLARSTKKGGRPRLDPDKAEKIKRSLAKGVSINATAKKLRVGVGTVHRLKQQMAQAA